MIVGYHIIFATYGFWLPNDPRGSWSTFVGSWELYRYGGPTKTTTRHSLAQRTHDAGLRRAAKSALHYPPVQFTGVQARAVGRGFARYFVKSKIPVWACAILPDHVHLVIGRSHIPAERLVIQLKGAASRELESEGIHPLAAWSDASGRAPRTFVHGQWIVYLDPPDVARAIRYVERNPLKEKKPLQKWSFVERAPAF